MNHLIKFGVKCFCYLLFITPEFIRHFLGKSFGIFWFDIIRFRRKIVLHNLTLAFPDLTLDEKIQIGRASLIDLCISFFETFTLPLLDKKWMDENIVFHGLEHCEMALQKGRGILFLSMHVGHGDMAINMISLKGIPISVITKKFSNKLSNDIWFQIRGQHGSQFIEAHGPKTAFEILRNCRENKGVIFVIDQHMGPPYGIDTTFFGHRVGTAYGLALFALKTKAPVIPVYTYRDLQNKTHIVFDSEIPLIPRGLADEDKSHKETEEEKQNYLRNMTQVYNDYIEGIVKKHPDKWMWIHKRWKGWSENKYNEL
jgi:KDO2-lipid IV(A) lauroyltransferase